MNKNARIYVLLCLSILGLIICNVYFIHKSNTPDTVICIGVSPDGDSIDFTKSDPLGKKDAHTVLFSLIQSIPTNDTQVSEVSPDALISVSESSENTALLITVWMTDNAVIVSSNPGDPSTYKAIESGWVDDFTELIQKQTEPYNQ